jgi:hypothetical protein
MLFDVQLNPQERGLQGCEEDLSVPMHGDALYPHQLPGPVAEGVEAVMR